MTTSNDGGPAREVVRIDLTAQQKEIVKAATSCEADAIELTVDELEQRITPTGTVTDPTGSFRLALNHNETLLADDR